MSIHWNLPPGCTPRDIDRAVGELTYCILCGKEVYRDQVDEDGQCKSCQEGIYMEGRE